MFKKLLALVLFAGFSFAGVTLPRPTGDVPFTVPGKGPDNLTNYKGKVVLLEFFIVSCPHCQRTAKVLSDIQRDYKAMGVRVISLTFRPEDDAAALKKFADEYKTNYTLGMIDGKVMAAFGQLTPEMRPTVPMVFFIDRDGLVQAQYFGTDPMMEEMHQAENLRAKLLFYMQQAPAPAKAGTARPAKK